MLSHVKQVQSKMHNAYYPFISEVSMATEIDNNLCYFKTESLCKIASLEIHLFDQKE